MCVFPGLQELNSVLPKFSIYIFALLYCKRVCSPSPTPALSLAPPASPSLPPSLPPSPHGATATPLLRSCLQPHDPRPNWNETGLWGAPGGRDLSSNDSSSCGLCWGSTELTPRAIAHSYCVISICIFTRLELYKLHVWLQEYSCMRPHSQVQNRTHM